MYEALAEGGITRLMGIIGSISEDSPAADRDWARLEVPGIIMSALLMNMMLFCAFWRTTYATKKMKELGIDHITGMYGAGVSAFRIRQLKHRTMLLLQLGRTK